MVASLCSSSISWGDVSKIHTNRAYIRKGRNKKMSGKKGESFEAKNKGGKQVNSMRGQHTDTRIFGRVWNPSKEDQEGEISSGSKEWDNTGTE